MFDLDAETVIPIREAPQHVPGKRVHISTVHRWMDRGVRNVRLESVLCGGRRMTSLEALQRFFEATTAAADAQPAPTTGHARQQQIEAAERFCTAEGA